MLNNKANFSGTNIEIIDFKELSKRNEKVDSIFVEIYRSDIERGHIQRYIKLFSTLEKKKMSLASKKIFVFRGYEQDPREIYEITEIRNWVTRLYKNKPHIFYYLCDYSETILAIFLCLSKIKVISSNHGRTNTQVVTDNNLITKIISSAIGHSIKRKDSEEEQINVGLTIAKALLLQNVDRELGD